MTNEQLKAALTANITKFLAQERKNIENGDVDFRTVDDSVSQQATMNVEDDYPEFWADHEEWYYDEVSLQVKAAFKIWS